VGHRRARPVRLIKMEGLEGPPKPPELGSVPA
jgi:hypothetical protein